MMGSYIFETQRVSGITGGLSGAAAAGNRPTIGLPDIRPVTPGSETRACRPGGNLANWKPEISRVCAAATVESSPSRSQREYRPTHSYRSAA